MNNQTFQVVNQGMEETEHEIAIPGYKISGILHTGSYSKVITAVDTAENIPVIIKILNPEELTPVQVSKFRQDYEIRNHINSPYVVKALKLDFFNHRPFIVMEDFGGKSLHSFMNGDKLDIPTFLYIAKKCVQALDIIHKKEVIHKDIKPCNILYNSGTDDLRFTDFGISTLLNYENPSLINPRSLEGTIAYISPEQTGRMNRFLDYRTDYYSLGITFYYLLSGMVPFDEASPMGMVHSHIAKNPPSLSSLGSNIPAAVSNIVMKLLNKNPEDRYQSSNGLIKDIEKCRDQFEKHGKIEPFIPGKSDFSDKFQIPEKLYGRSKEIDELKNSLYRAQGGNTEIVMVSGYSGSGKTALVNELKKEISGSKLFFISGKFDQLNKKQAYSAIIEAFRDLIIGILSETEDRINIWKEAILHAVGENGKIITDLIPRLELIIGKQPELPKISVSETRNRFNYTFKNFLNVFAKPGKPLVLFLDDIQWIDSASLGLLRALMINLEVKNFLLIGSYRNNELDKAHPLFMFLRDVKSGTCFYNEIETYPLSFKDTLELVKDTIGSDEARSYQLSSLVYKKTGANPFFVKEFLKNLHTEKLLYFSYEKKKWHWNFEEIQTKNITKNVLELIIKRIQKLPKETLHILKYAACLGNRFSFRRLLSVCGMEQGQFFRYLWKAIKEGIIIPVGESGFKLRSPFTGKSSKSDFTSDLIFQHDKVQQASYSMIDKEEVPLIHYKIGKSILSETDGKNFDDNIFEIVNQLNLGLSFIKSEEGIDELIALNLIAGKRAKQASAFKRSLSYLTNSFKLLPDSEKKGKSPFVKEIYTEFAEAKYLCGEFKDSEKLLIDLLEKVDTNVEKGGVYELIILIQTMNAEYEKALLTGQKALSLLNIHLPLENIIHETSAEVNTAIKKLMRANITNLINSPEMKDPEKKIAMKILIRLQATSYFSRSRLYPFILAKMTNFSIDYGHTAESAKGYASFANIFAYETQDFKTAHEIGRLGLKISRKFKDRKIEVQTRLSMSAFLIHGISHLRQGEENIRKGYQLGLECGEIQYSGLLLFSKVHNRFFQGIPLHRLEEEVPGELEFCIKTGNNIGIDVITPFKLAVLNLRGKTESEFHFSDAAMTCDQYFEKFANNRSPFAIFLLRLLKAFIFFIYNHFDRAFTEIKKAEEHIFSSLGYFSETEFHFLNALIHTAVYDSLEKEEQKKTLEIIDLALHWLKKRAASSPDNYNARYFLVKAEYNKIIKNYDKAADLYDKAIEASEEYDYIQILAIANETCARFWKSRKKEKLARPYYEDALNAYRNWGALKKIKMIEKHLPQSSSYLLHKNMNSYTTTITSSYPDSEIDYSAALDMESVAQTSQAISSEVDLEKLLKKLMKIMLESAGAAKGFIILKSGNNLKIEAAARTDQKRINVLESIPVEDHLDLSESIVRYVIHTGEDVVLNDVSKTNLFSKDPWISKNKTKSILCTPVHFKDKTIGVLYLENNLSTNVFSNDRLKIIKNLLPQAAISIDNALLFAESVKLTKSLEKEVEQRKIIQAKLEKSEKKYREIFENTRDIYIETTMDGAIIEASPSVVESSLFARDELIGETVNNRFINSIDRIHLINELKVKDKISNFEALCKNKNGDDIYCSINAMLGKDDAGKPEKIIVSIRDITEKKQLELRLFQSQKMEAIGTLAGGIAHDFNNILAGITGYTDIAFLKINKEPEKIPKYLHGIIKASERAKNLVSQILSFSRSSETDKKRINPLPVIREALKLLRSSIPSSIEIVQKIDIDSISIMGNTTHIHQVIMNLCTNAAHSMKKQGGKLFVDLYTKKVQRNQIQSIEGFVARGDYLVISIKDTGHGIPEEIKSKIFDPYFTTKRTGEGTGLGLAMVQGIVQNHEGFIRFKTRAEKGSHFTIFIPVLDEKSKEIESSAKYFTPHQGVERILFVDDEEILVGIIKDMLEDCGYKVTATTNPVEALNLFMENPDNYDVVISDMTMPVLTGDKLSEEILRIKKDTPIIICTGYSESVTESKLKDLGVSKKLTKPFNLETLSQAIREVMNKD